MANGWYLANGTGPEVGTPVNLMGLRKNDQVKINRTTDVWKQPKHVFTVVFESTNLVQKNSHRAAA